MSEKYKILELQMAEKDTKGETNKDLEDQISMEKNRIF